MVNKQFISFLDKLKTPRNAALVESVKKGYVLCEMGPVTPTQDAMGVEVDETEFMPAKEYDEFGFDAEGEPMGVDEMMAHHPDAYNEYGYEDFNSVDGVEAPETDFNAGEAEGECSGYNCAPSKTEGHQYWKYPDDSRVYYDWKPGMVAADDYDCMSYEAGRDYRTSQAQQLTNDRMGDSGRTRRNGNW